MFTPTDMTPAERTLLRTVIDQTIRAWGATTQAEVARATSAAEQTAAEMIWAQRAELATPEPEEPLDGYLAWYYETLQVGAEMRRVPMETDPLGFIVTEEDSPPG